MEDPGITKLTGMQQEYEQHKKRIAERASELRARAEAAEIDLKECGLLIAELFDEMHDTALSFQSDLTDTIKEDWVRSASEEEEDDDNGDDVDPGELDSLLLPGDASTIMASLQAHLSMIDSMLEHGQKGMDQSQAAQLQQMRDQARSAIELVELITFDPDQEEETEAEAESGGGTQAN